MFKKTTEEKVLRDPVHGYIHVDLQVVWDVINSSWFQRLRRIRQLGGAYVVYHCAEHSRFGHSLGVYELVRRMVSEVQDISNALNEREKVTAMLAGLLHDIGHGPYSHAFEGVTKTSHEEFTCRIIEENTEITKILEDCCEGLSKDVADVIRHESSNPLLSQLISSQLDADRFDYLLRDAYFTGTKYGEYDFPRFLQIFAAQQDDNGTLSLCVDEKDLPVAESLLIARYHYNLQIPYHRTRSGFDFALKKFASCHTDYQNIFDVTDNKIKKIEFDKFSILDDGTIFEQIKQKYITGDKWAACLLRQSHLHPIVDTHACNEKGTQQFKYFVQKLRSSQLKENEDFFVQEQNVEMIKRAKPADEGGTSPTGIRLLVKEGINRQKKQVDIAECSWIFAHLNDTDKIYRVYAAPGKKEIVAAYLA